MDLKFSNAEPSAEERDSVDRLLGVGEGGWHGGERDELDHRRAHTGREARARRHLVMEALHALNDRVGWISPDGQVQEYALPTPSSEPHGLTIGTDGAVYVALEAGSIARLAR